MVGLTRGTRRAQREAEVIVDRGYGQRVRPRPGPPGGPVCEYFFAGSSGPMAFEDVRGALFRIWCEKSSHLELELVQQLHHVQWATT